MTANFQNIVLIGFMGVGKSTLARQLAARLGWDWIDTDRRIEEQTNLTAAAIFEQQGEAAFRDLEGAVLASLIGVQQTVISTGGGTVLRPQNRELLRQLGLVVGLFASEEVTWERVSRNQRRPLLQTADPRQTLRTLLQERLPIYESLADLQLDTGLQKHARCVSRIVQFMEGQ